MAMISEDRAFKLAWRRVDSNLGFKPWIKNGNQKRESNTKSKTEIKNGNQMHEWKFVPAGCAYLLATLHDTQARLQFDFIWGLLLSILSAVILLVTLLSSRIETSNNTLHNGHFL